MRHLESAGHRGHGTERTLGNTTGAKACFGMPDARVRQLSDGAMTGGSQPTNIRGIDRRGKVPGGPLSSDASSDTRSRAGPPVPPEEADLTGQSISGVRTSNTWALRLHGKGQRIWPVARFGAALRTGRASGVHGKGQLIHPKRRQG